MVRGKLRRTIILKPLLLEGNGGFRGSVLVLCLLPILVKNELLGREGLLLALALAALRANGRVFRYDHIIILVFVLLLFLLLEWSRVLVIVVVVIITITIRLWLIAIGLRGANLWTQGGG